MLKKWIIFTIIPIAIAVGAYFVYQKHFSSKQDDQVAEGDLIAKGGHGGGGHHGGGHHGGRHGGHHGGHHGHHGNHNHHNNHKHNNNHNQHWNHNHNNNWWHHNHNPGWSRGGGWNNWHHPWHDWYWYGGATALGLGATKYAGYYYDPNYYYSSSGQPSIEYENDAAPNSQQNTPVSVQNNFNDPLGDSSNTGQDDDDDDDTDDVDDDDNDDDDDDGDDEEQNSITNPGAREKV